jgi:hypothetical protein
VRQEYYYFPQSVHLVTFGKIGTQIHSERASNLNDGQIVSFDIVSQKWYVELDDPDDDDEYLIAYDAVCEYSNKEHSTFNRYQLHYKVVVEGDDEIETEDGTLYSLTPAEDWTQVYIEEGDG